METAHTGIIAVGGRQAELATKRTTLRVMPINPIETIIDVPALVLRHLHIRTPPVRVVDQDWSHLTGLRLANPTFMNPMDIDLVLGADVYGRILQNGVSRGGPEDPVAQKTSLGWIITGAATKRPAAGSPPRDSLTLSTAIERDDIARALHRFWEIEDTPRRPPRSSEDEECERLFLQGLRRLPNGRYSVRLPWKARRDLGQLAATRSMALRALDSARARMEKDAYLRREYETFMADYERLGHMSVTDPKRQKEVGPICYITHHGIWQTADQGKKLRVVFNASRRYGTSASLNELLHAGPALQTDIVTILMRWRLHRIVLCADIEMMYRQILVDPGDVDLQRIVWKRPGDKEASHFRLLTLTYGMTCAPYLAIRVLQQLARDEGALYPEAANAVLRHTYVDDILSGAPDQASAESLRDQMVGLLKKGGFHLRKWASNCPEIIRAIPHQDQLRPEWRDFEDGDPIKTLGVSWDPTGDEFRFRAPKIQNFPGSTKRQVLAAIAKLFDPCGWLSPVVVTAKMLMQDLWRQGLEWDEPLPPDLASRWATFVSHLPAVSGIHLPRWTGTTPTATIELHGFADASKHAYAAAVYISIQSDHDNAAPARLLLAKTKVAPVKTLSIPRLELCAAVLVARLLHQVSTEFAAYHPAIHAWSDSCIVLAWIHADPARWNVFVANRVAEISREVPTATWRHVPSIDNPADIASRGVTPERLARADLWWSGPEWISQLRSRWPRTPELEDSDLPEQLARETSRRRICCPTLVDDDFINSFSSLTRLERVVARCIRFLRLSNTVQRRPMADVLTCDELELAYLRCVAHTQRQAFPDEVGTLLAGQPIPRASPMANLTPFLDEHGVLRILGRLQGAPLPYSERHPVILPKDCRLSYLIIRWAHQSSLHGGPTLTYSYVMRKAWIIGGRSRTRQVVRSCIRCARSTARPTTQLMGNLPAGRVTPGRPFSISGLDYAGPFAIKTSKGRGVRTSKGYIALFVCFPTKAVHLEVVGDLTTAAFLAALRRFSGRRGVPRELWSDNATTLHGADAELRSMFREANLQWGVVADTLANEGIRWQFIPPAAPHFGGLWEAAVKSAKRHLKRVVGSQLLTYEEFNTLIIQIEMAMNSRPLTPMSGLPEDRGVLTPGHFLIGTGMTSIAEPLDATLRADHLRHWRLVQRLYHEFWTRWAGEYLHTLQQRKKWIRPKTNLRPNDLVLVLDPAQLSNGRWPLGHVVSVYPGRDGLVRAVDVRTATGTYRRPIAKLAIIPME